jgi:multidrug efflux pump subunit AcrB
MNLLQFLYGSLRKPITVLVAVLAIVFFSILSIRTMPVDIFPKLGTPAIYVAQTYGGLSPDQLEGFITSYYEYHFLYVTGIKSVESKTIQGITLLKLNFYEGTDMGQATGEVIAMVNRARAFMPPGTVSPFVTRFDGGSVAIGQLIFNSPDRSLSEIQDLALFKVRPMFSTLPGVSAPPPFGGNQKTILVKPDLNKLRTYQISPDELVTAIAQGNTITPSGNFRYKDKIYMTPENTVVEDIREFENIPLKTGSGTSVYVHDLATVSTGADITSGYALINGKRSVYIPVTKRADASTWDVVQKVKAALPDMQAAIPQDIHISYAFDQSIYVLNALESLTTEGILGALLTGFMVLLFLRDWRGAFIVVLTIPLAVLSALIFLKLLGQSINIMTLGGLALAIGILVDEATVTIENIHHFQEMNLPKGRAIIEACKEIAIPKFLILVSVLVVFLPAFFMSGIPKAMFLPLSLAVGLSMISSFLLSQSFVPVLANWFFKDGRIKSKDNALLRTLITGQESWFSIFSGGSKILSWTFLLGSLILCILFFRIIGKELFPRGNSGQIQIRIRLPEGTRLERTEDQVKKVLYWVDSLTGKNKIEISSAFFGVQPSSYPVNVIHLWTSGSFEGVIKIKFKDQYSIPLEDLREKIRKRVDESGIPMKIVFEPADLVDQVMNQGTGTPIQIRILGKNLASERSLGKILIQKLSKLPYLRDLDFESPGPGPALKLDFDRVRLGQMGLNIEEASKSLVAATSSSRFTQPNYWLDRLTGTAYQVQVQVPEYIMNDPQQIENIPLKNSSGAPVFMRDVSTWKMGNIETEYDRLNQKRYISINANLHDIALGKALDDINALILGLGKLPEGTKLMEQGQSGLFEQTFSELGMGFLIALVGVFLLLSINFQSFRISFTILSILPGVMSGSFLLLILFNKTLNIQSYMGCITAIGVSLANSILYVNQAEKYRRQKLENGYLLGIKDRIRPILMTSLAMVAGMLPMSLGLGKGGDQTSPLGIAVIGGLIFSLLISLVFLPLLYRDFMGNKPAPSLSLDPDDPNSSYFLNPETRP